MEFSRVMSLQASCSVKRVILYPVRLDYLIGGRRCTPVGYCDQLDRGFAQHCFHGNIAWLARKTQ